MTGETDNLYKIPFTLSEESQVILNNNVNSVLDLRDRIYNACKPHGFELRAVHWVENIIIVKKI
jgi:hypothetical protein